MGHADSSVLEIIRNALKMELEGKDFFHRAASRMSHAHAKDMFSGLAEQEQRHIDVLSRQLGRLESDQGLAPVNESVKDGPGYPEKSVFKDRDIKRIALKPDAGELEVIGLGMEVEKKSIVYYEQALAGASNERAKELYSWLVGEEQGHLTILRAEYDNRSQSGFYYDSAEFSLEVE